MPVYLIGEIKLTDESWVPEYAAKVPDLVHRHGGRYLTRASAVTPLEGDPPAADIFVIMEFPSLEALQALAEDPDYLPYGEARRSGADNRFFVVNAEDVAGTISYLAPPA